MQFRSAPKNCGVSGNEAISSVVDTRRKVNPIRYLVRPLFSRPGRIWKKYLPYLFREWSQSIHAQFR